MFKVHITLGCLFLFYFNVLVCFAKSSHNTFNFSSVELINCYDGDTCRFNILDSHFPQYLNPMSIRVYGVDTKEMKSKNLQDKEKAIEAKNFTINFVKVANKDLKLINCIKDKYFIFDCEFTFKDKNLAQELINNNLAIPYFGGKKSN